MLAWIPPPPILLQEMLGRLAKRGLSPGPHYIAPQSPHHRSRYSRFTNPNKDGVRGMMVQQPKEPYRQRGP